MNLVAIYEVEGGVDPISYMAKGHFKAEEFLAEFLRKFKRVAESKDVLRGYVRNVPWAGPDGWVTILVKAAGPERGAFPVTYVNHEWAKPCER